jgi:hypothetical protein
MDPTPRNVTPDGGAGEFERPWNGPVRDGI